ncbi:hypothetical protein DPMN_083263 [Dreissena polymorpha]|uniref:Uncharacterized protein n=1 Tax=Dreissena polymorpha TaxID=45954 RepID=A0A9D3YC39_DREPO|nr:hypothetical protein DPMN_083263 [Dreissena polymorpha]
MCCSCRPLTGHEDLDRPEAERNPVDTVVKVGRRRLCRQSCFSLQHPTTNPNKNSMIAANSGTLCLTIKSGNSNFFKTKTSNDKPITVQCEALDEVGGWKN